MLVRAATHRSVLVKHNDLSFTYQLFTPVKRTGKRAFYKIEKAIKRLISRKKLKFIALCHIAVYYRCYHFYLIFLLDFIYYIIKYCILIVNTELYN